MKLITEEINEVQLVTEAKGDKKELFIEGIFMQSEKRNRNGRIYSKPILEKAVNEYDRTFVKTGRAVGELNHPPTPTINLDKVSHLITSLKWEGNDVYGKAKILETPMGVIARGLLEGGVQLGVSSRGMGSIVEKNGIAYVNDDFILNTVDIVADPSAQEAFVNGIMEGADWVYNAASGNWIKQEQISNLAHKAKKASKLDEAKLLKEFKAILLSVK